MFQTKNRFGASDLLRMVGIISIAMIVFPVVHLLPPTATLPVSNFLKKFSFKKSLTSEDLRIQTDNWYQALRRAKHYFKIPLTCLSEALILRTALGFSGIESQIRLGIRSAATPQAHAWLHIVGLERANENESAYTPFDSSPL